MGLELLTQSGFTSYSFSTAKPVVIWYRSLQNNSLFTISVNDLIWNLREPNTCIGCGFSAMVSKSSVVCGMYCWYLKVGYGEIEACCEAEAHTSSLNT